MAMFNSYVKLPEGTCQSNTSYLDIFRRSKTHCRSLSHMFLNKHRGISPNNFLAAYMAHQDRKLAGPAYVSETLKSLNLLVDM